MAIPSYAYENSTKERWFVFEFLLSILSSNMLKDNKAQWDLFQFIIYYSLSHTESVLFPIYMEGNTSNWLSMFICRNGDCYVAMVAYFSFVLDKSFIGFLANSREWNTREIGHHRG